MMSIAQKQWRQNKPQIQQNVDFHWLLLLPCCLYGWAWWNFLYMSTISTLILLCNQASRSKRGLWIITIKHLKLASHSLAFAKGVKENRNKKVATAKITSRYAAPITTHCKLWRHNLRQGRTKCLLLCLFRSTMKGTVIYILREKERRVATTMKFGLE